MATRIPSLPLLVMHLSWRGKKARISFQDSTRNWPDDWRDGGIHPNGGTDCRRRRETSFVFGRMKKRSVILHVRRVHTRSADAVTKDEQTRWEIEWQIQRLQRAAIPFPSASPSLVWSPNSAGWEAGRVRVASVEEGGDKAICSIILRVHWTHRDGGRERTNTAIYIGKWPKFLRRDRPRAAGLSLSLSINRITWKFNMVCGGGLANTFANIYDD